MIATATACLPMALARTLNCVHAWTWACMDMGMHAHVQMQTQKILVWPAMDAEAEMHDVKWWILRRPHRPARI